MKFRGKLGIWPAYVNEQAQSRPLAAQPARGRSDRARTPYYGADMSSKHSERESLRLVAGKTARGHQKPPVSGTSRRDFLKLVGIGLAAPAFVDLGACADDKGAAPVTIDVASFPQGVASGDPRPDSVVLWARIEPQPAIAEHRVTLLIDTAESLDAPLVEQELVAGADHDHIVKIKVSGLDAGTTYYYQFVYEADGQRLGSRVARTKTAPAADADVPFKIALASCQDFVARYYNSYAKMSQEADLDLVVHVGDYIYETTGDASFQSGGNAERGVTFSDTAGAIAFFDAAGEVTHYAAQSLSNYRELYRRYRSDPWLQRVHEQVPFVFIWDDHEFSDDCWGDTATYFDGRSDENHQRTRRENAERANFEYLPTELGLDAAGAAFDIGSKLPVSDPTITIYRDFRFGRHVHLVLTDTRSYRPDHAIPEDVHPARIAILEDELEPSGLDPAATKGDGTPLYVPYVELDAALAARVIDALVVAYGKVLDDDEAALRARATAQATGPWSAVALNTLLAESFDVSPESDLPRGATYDHMRYAPNQLFASDGLGARYLVERRHYDAYQKARYARDPRSQDVLGAAQEAWLRSTIASSTATWKVVATSISMTSMIVDARRVPASLVGTPDEAAVTAGLNLFKSLLPTSYYLSVDQWDGFGDKRAELLSVLRSQPNCMLLAGDIHSFYATSHGQGDGQHGVVELTGGGISSESFKGFVRRVVNGIVPGIMSDPNVAATVENLEHLFRDNFAPLVYANNDAHGFVAVSFGATEANATLYVAPIAHVEVEAGDVTTAAAPFEAIGFRAKDGALTRT